jgi:hypothetical protein
MNNEAGPSLRCGRAVFLTNMARPTNTSAIPLGVFCEIKTSQVHALALKARTLLSQNEIDAIAPVLRKPLANPFQFLSSEFDAAWAGGLETSGALAFLTKKHAAALSVLAPYHPATADRASWWRGLFGEPKVNALLESVVDGEFDSLLSEIPCWDGPTPPPVLRMQLAAAA